MSVYGHGPTRREQAILDLHEEGKSLVDIGNKLDVSPHYAAQVVRSLAQPPLGDWQKSARQGSASLLRALQRHHPERCGVRS